MARREIYTQAGHIGEYGIRKGIKRKKELKEGNGVT